MTWWLFLISGIIIPRKSWSVRGSHSEVETRVGFTYVFLVDGCRDVIDCDVELH